MPNLEAPDHRQKRHFTAEQWSDYVRGLAPEHNRLAIERHLKQECKQCQTASRFWTTVRNVAGREVLNQAPGPLVQKLKAAFAGWRRETLPVRAKFATITFDTLLRPALMGVRGKAPSSRRIVGRSGQWVIDVRLEQRPDRQLSVTGQVFKPTHSPSILSSIEISLMRGKVVLGMTTANEFGEFQIASDSARELELYVEVPGRKPMAVLLTGNE